MKKLWLIALLFLFKQLHAQETLLDSLVKQFSYPVVFTEGRLSGPGADFILKKTKNAQFVNLGEEHNAKDIPVFTTALFTLLQKQYGFEFLALEQDPLTGRIGLLNEIAGGGDFQITTLKHNGKIDPSFSNGTWSL